MAKFETNMGFVRAIASWQPITKNASGSPVLENIAMMIEGREILIVATDRYRLIYARVTPVHMEAWEDKKLFPMRDFTDTTLLNKTIKDHESVVFDMPDGERTYTITVAGKTVTYDVVNTNYPSLENLLNEWRPVDTIPNKLKFNMKLLADFPKFADPNEGVVTAAKRDNGWLIELGESKAIRFHQGHIERFGVLVMPMTIS